MARTLPDRPLRPATLLVRGGQMRSNHDETSEALYLTSGFVYESAGQAEDTFLGTTQHYQYSRFGNPTVTMLEDRLAALEGAEACRLTATGMAAVHAAMLSHLKAGDRVVASRALFGSCHWIVSTLLPRYGITSVFVDGGDLAQWKAALAQPTALVLLETPSNPMLDVLDLAAVCDLAHAAGALVVADNVFATPLLQKPMEFGADVVVYSCTKHMDGQGRVLGGAVLGRKKWVDEVLQPFIRNTGPSISPFNAWVILKGLETLHLRLPAMCRAAAAIADFLAERVEIDRVLYPFRVDHPQQALAKAQMAAGGSLVTFDVKGGKEAAFRFLDALQLIDVSNNLGDAKSLVTHPATTTHMRVGAEERARLGITDGTIRLSVGLEDVADLIADLSEALDAIAPAQPPVKRAKVVIEEPAAAEPEAPAIAPKPRKAARAKAAAQPADATLFELAVDLPEAPRRKD
ncbi:O-succinylhomoserine sulfhydrylase [Falsiroseomonas selenitidurans]|uniref:O-succinylhomoserine sulfhydrylase n=1 Tax=Falsiroseomonas selenitidurans TaxID=2716335 RepID=A0ABX1E7P2_9PROT|nr:O-succinylhomoserine sulfhydrylase [Falsiroseomonas selenitidurans]NKC33211.1 O-succinylhomoserine sulfhydrylase [Falsiroseomonas selenitidurans]